MRGCLDEVPASRVSLACVPTISAEDVAVGGGECVWIARPAELPAEEAAVASMRVSALVSSDPASEVKTPMAFGSWTAANRAAS